MNWTRICHRMVLLLTAMGAVIAVASNRQNCPVKKLDVERLPDLNIPRSGSTALFVGGEVMVAGGHTNGFVPTATAEFLRLGDSEWRVEPMVYAHDFGISVLLHSGQVLLAGGAAEPLGIGQTFMAERYDPVTHSFEGFGCLDTKRMYPQAAELKDGQVVIGGNWYHEDAIEVYDGHRTFSPVKSVSQGRSAPFIFPVSADDAVIFGLTDTRGNQITEGCTTADRLRGDPFDLPLLSEWHPIAHFGQAASQSLIGNEAEDDYAYLMTVRNQMGDVAIALFRDTTLNLLPGLEFLPTKGIEGAHIYYATAPIVDRKAQCGYVIGTDTLDRRYIYCFNYRLQADRPTVSVVGSSARLLYTDPLSDLGLHTTPVLTSDGDIVLVAGKKSNNFAPMSAAYRLPVGHPDTDSLAATGDSSRHWWLWLLAIALLLVAVMMVCWYRRAGTMGSRQDSAKAEASAEPTANELLFQRIRQLMEEQKPYLNSDLKLSDVADALGTHRNTVSACINSQLGYSFSQFVNIYRVEHAKQLMRQYPDKKMAAVIDESGFSNETSFFRAFKALTGTTPKLWMTKND